MSDVCTVAGAPGPPARRVTCPRCERPLPTCLCDLVQTVANRIPVLILQHPLEARQAKGSVSLLRLSLAQCRVEVGEQFDPVTLDALLVRPDGGRSLLLYPDVPAAPAPDDAPLSASSPVTQLVVLDATWRKSLRMLLHHPALRALPRLALAGSPPSAYARMRQAPVPHHQRSTLEATCQALAVLEGGDAGSRQGYDGLQAAFAQWVARMAGYKG